MNIKELIKELKKYPQDSLVLVREEPGGGPIEVLSVSSDDEGNVEIIGDNQGT